MPIISISKSDLLKGQPITPGWYSSTITEFVVKSPKNSSDSMNYVPTFKVEIPGKPEDEFPEIDHTFNSKGIGFMVPFIAALAGKSVNEIAAGMKSGALEFDTETVKGKRLRIYIDNEIYEGRTINKVKKFLNINDNPPF